MILLMSLILFSERLLSSFITTSSLHSLIMLLDHLIKLSPLVGTSNYETPPISSMKFLD